MPSPVAFLNPVRTAAPFAVANRALVAERIPLNGGFFQQGHPLFTGFGHQANAQQQVVGG